MTRVAITGAGGFLGSALAQHLNANGFEVNALVRSRDSSTFLPPEVQVFVGDINDPQELARAFSGTDTVFHLVSNFRDPNPTEVSHYSTNVEGTKTALTQAIDAGVRRFVHCSTIGVHGDVQGLAIDETGPFAPGDLYQETKLEAELWCRQQIGRSDTEIVIIRPTSLYGPGDLRMLKMFRGLVARQFPIIGECKEHFHPCYIDDAVAGFTLAGTQAGIDGEVFFIGAPNSLPLAEYIEVAINVLDAKRPLIKLPYLPMEKLARACEIICKPLGIAPPLNVRRVRFYKNNRSFTTRKAKEMMGFEANVDLRSGMQRTVNWYKENGYL